MDSLEGAWHVEGMSHENIVATAVCVIEQTKNVKQELFFKRKFTKCEVSKILTDDDDKLYDYPYGGVEYINKFLSVNYEYDDNLHEKDKLDGLLPLGHVSTETSSLIVFPNSHIHKLDLKNNSKTKGHRTVVVFWLINPDVRIISTKNINRQQNTTSFTSKEAKIHRLELMEERKHYKQSFNIRNINLCEH